ncbi:MAG: relaxase/mobilization nuclease domain-containing protein [Streptosporangiaceae bacterium]
MIDVIKRGRNVAGLLYYLYGPGKANEHTDPHLVAGWREVPSLEPAIRPDGKRDFRKLAGLLNAPLDALGARADAKPVWHCILSAAPADRLLSDNEWQNIADDFMHRMGLARRADESGVRWVTVRHGLSAGGIDHVHIVATLARQDGRRPWLRDDYLRAREACLAIEQQYGLQSTAPADRTAAQRPTRAENERAQRHGRNEAPRITLRRHVQEAAAAGACEQEFFTRLERAGIMVRKRFSDRDPGQVTGYAVGLPDDTAQSGGPVWYSGGRLAADLTLPKLRRRWEHSGNAEHSGTRPEQGLSARSVRAMLRSTAWSAAEQSRDEPGFFARLGQAGILVRQRFSDLDPEQVTGYSVTLPGHVDAQGQTAWYGGGRLAADLTLPRLRRRWNAPPSGREAPVSPEERRAIWDDVTQAANRAAEQIRGCAGAEPAAAADTAWATADALRTAARVLGGGSAGVLLGQAADQYDRAARECHGRIPQSCFAGADLRRAARLLAVLGAGGSNLTLTTICLITSLAALAAEVARLRDTQQRTAQAVAARAAAADLREAARRAQEPAAADTRVAQPSQAAPASAARLAQTEFPLTPRHADKSSAHPPRPAPPPGSSRRPPRAPGPRR